MSLDNGICVRRTPKTNMIEELKVFNDDLDTELKHDFEITYWRKNWGLRNDILWILIDPFEDRYEYSVRKNELDEIIELLQSYNSETWTNSIWDWDDEEYPYSEYIKKNIEDLKHLRALMDRYELEVYFYDSY